MSETPPGEIIYRWEPPDTSFITYIGYITGDHARELHAASWRHRSGIPYGFVLIDVSRLVRLSPEAREVAKANTRAGREGEAPLRGTAIFGASFHIRVIAHFGTLAWNLLKRHDDNPIRFFDTEASARAWIDERRRGLKAQGIEPPQNV